MEPATYMYSNQLQLGRISFWCARAGTRRAGGTSPKNVGSDRPETLRPGSRAPGRPPARKTALPLLELT
jgi:hypothetical protein